MVRRVRGVVPRVWDFGVRVRGRGRARRRVCDRVPSGPTRAARSVRSPGADGGQPRRPRKISRRAELSRQCWRRLSSVVAVGVACPAWGHSAVVKDAFASKTWLAGQSARESQDQLGLQAPEHVTYADEAIAIEGADERKSA